MNAIPDTFLDVREWTQEFLTACGALLEIDVSRRCIEAVIPEALSAKLATDFVRIPLTSESGSSTDMLSAGSSFLESLIKEALLKGSCARWYLWAQIRKTLSLDDLRRKAFLKGSQFKGFCAKTVYVPCVLFSFQVSYVCDDKQEELFSVFIHPFLGRILPYAPYESVITAQENELGFEEIILPSVEGIYQTAQKEAVFAIEKRRNLYQEREQRRFEREAKRVKEYFISVRKDLERRMLRETAAEAKKKTLLAKIRVCEAEEERKILDLKEKHRLLVRFRLVNAAKIFVPEILAQITIGERGAAEFSTGEVFWDPILKETLFPVCPLCRGEVTQITICPRCQTVLPNPHWNENISNAGLEN